MLQWTLRSAYHFELVFSFSLDKYPKVELLDHMVALFLIFWGSSVLFSIVAVPVYSSINSPQASFLSTSWPPFAIFLIKAALTDARWYLLLFFSGQFFSCLLMSQWLNTLKMFKKETDNIKTRGRNVNKYLRDSNPIVSLEMPGSWILKDSRMET